MQNMQNLTLQLIALLSAFALGTGGASVVGLIVINGPNSTSCCAILQQQLPGKVSLPIQGLYEDEYSSSELEHKLACRVNSLEDRGRVYDVVCSRWTELSVRGHVS
ncbi:hypothetical protein WG66_003613 [Moniliophthora roreri]|nr:hypothetical protein WG66_003613 [Moniliophthora roreri]